MVKPNPEIRSTKLVSNALDAAVPTYADRARLKAIIDQFTQDGTTEDEVIEYLRKLVAIQKAYPGPS